MKERIEQYLAEALSVLQANGTVPSGITPPIEVTRTRDAAHGDLASNLAMMLARPAGREPRDMALALIEALPSSDAIRDVLVAGPGFINFHLAEEVLSAVVPSILTRGSRFGRSDLGAGQRIQVSFVLANQGERLQGTQVRGAGLAATMANLLDAAGFEVQRKICTSDPDQRSDARVGARMGEDDPQPVFDHAPPHEPSTLKKDLADLGVHPDSWLSARSLSGDDKDRSMVQANGQDSCLACDIACIADAFDDGVDKVLHIFQSDHHDHVTRLLAACTASGYSREKLEFLQVPVTLRFHGREHVPRTSGPGSSITLRSLLDEVGHDAARYFTVMRKASQHLDFDLDLARAQSIENPVYHVQYAHARVCSVLRQLEQRRLTFDQETGLAVLPLLTEPAEYELMGLLAGYPDIVRRAALVHEPHRLTGYLRDLANGLHSYYSAHKVVVDNDELRHARMCLLLAVRQVLGNGLSLIGVSTPEVM